MCLFLPNEYAYVYVGLIHLYREVSYKYTHVYQGPILNYIYKLFNKSLQILNVPKYNCRQYTFYI